MQRSDSLSALSVQQNQIACIPSQEFNFIYASKHSGSLVASKSLEKEMKIQTGRNLHFCLSSSRMSASMSLCELGTASILFATSYPQHPYCFCCANIILSYLLCICQHWVVWFLFFNLLFLIT